MRGLRGAAGGKKLAENAQETVRGKLEEVDGRTEQNARSCPSSDEEGCSEVDGRSEQDALSCASSEEEGRS